MFLIFHNLKDYDCHLIMQELDSFNLKINDILNGQEKYMTFRVIVIESIQFLSSFLNSSFKNAGKDDFKILIMLRI